MDCTLRSAKFAARRGETVTSTEKPKHTMKPDNDLRVRAQVPAKLVVVSGPDEGLEVSLDTQVDIGSDPGCTLHLQDPAVSRLHATIVLIGDSFVVRDRGSSNGTFLGGTQIMEAHVPLGSVLTLGDTTLAIHPRYYTREVSPSRQHSFGELRGVSIAMREVFAILEQVAPSEVSVLIEGESGTGKELAARSIHQASSRRDEPYVVFDCTSIPHSLAESELFGHKRGAFSGAVSDRIGAFGRADGGTICLDEIGELPAELQPKLLRVLESGEVRPVGSDEPRKLDVRVIASTNRDLQAEASRGNFRPDLLYRLEVVRVRIPPLRHRPQDIPALVAHFLEGRLPPGDEICGDNLESLMSYSWPGNVRELRNTIDRAVALAARREEPAPTFDQLVFNLGPAPSSPITIGTDYPGVSSPLPYKQAKAQLLSSFERAYVEALMRRHQGSVTKAAEAAGLSRKHLYSLLERVKTGSGVELDAD